MVLIFPDSAARGKIKIRKAKNKQQHSICRQNLRNWNCSDMEEFFARMKAFAAKVDSEVDDLESKAESIR